MMEPLLDCSPLEGGSGTMRDKVAACCSFSTLKAWLPILGWLPKYQLTWLRMDLIAGITVGLTTVPQALAYAEVAGLPVQYGLYSAFMGGFIYCIFGTSKDVTLGPTAIMSLLCAFYIGNDPVYAVLLTFLSGIIQTSMALLSLGSLLDFISYPVIKGFTCAAAITIGFGQIKNLLGLQNISQQFFLEVYDTFHRLPEARVPDAVLGLLCLSALVTLTLMKSSLGPGPDDLPVHVRGARGLVWALSTVRNALVVICATGLSYSFEVTGQHVFTITGHTAAGLPSFQAPPFSETTPNGTVITFRELAQDLGDGLIVIPLMGLLESIAIAKAFASQNNYRINGNQELFAIGLTNILGSFVSAYPVTGSFGRTAVNSQTGVCTPAGGIITSVIVLLSLAFLMPLFYYIPKASLAAVIICAVTPMFDYHVVAKFWRVKKLDLLPFLVTFLLSFWQVQYGIVAGVAVSGCLLLYHVARPQLKVRDHGVLVVELDSGLRFPAMQYLSQTLFTKALMGECHLSATSKDNLRPSVYDVVIPWSCVPVSPPRSVVLDCCHVSGVDYTVVNELRDLLRQFQQRGEVLVFTGLSHSVLQDLLKAELPDFEHMESVEAGLQAVSGKTFHDCHG
ncbi:sodium-independent sulfate anion transporter [Arapaima gigas]